MISNFFKDKIRCSLHERGLHVATGFVQLLSSCMQASTCVQNHRAQPALHLQVVLLSLLHSDTCVCTPSSVFKPIYTTILSFPVKRAKPYMLVPAKEFQKSRPCSLVSIKIHLTPLLQFTCIEID